MYRLYLYKFLIDFWTIVPVIVPFYKAHGMSATRILTIQAAFSLSQLVFEIPSGYLSDVIGRRRTLILAAAFMITGIGLYTVSDGFWWFIAAETILGAAGALRSGTDSALLYDHLKNIRDEHLYRKYEGHAEFWSRTGTAVSSITGGILGAYVTLRLPFYVNLVSAGIMLITGISLCEPPREQRPQGNPLRNILRTAGRSVSNPGMLSLMLQMGLFFSTGVTAIWGFFILFRQFRLPLFWHGFIFAVMQLASAFTARHAAAVESLLGRKATGVLLIVPGACLVLIGYSNSIGFILPLVMLHAAIWGFSTPILLEKLQQLTTSDIRATTLSVGSMIGRILTFTIGPVFGHLIDRHSTVCAFVILGIFFCIGFPAATLLSVAQRRSGDTFLSLQQDST
ncbi:MAG: MFS transporter [Chitinispirillaceae bacterium]|nr:MFS transporter [Chitinispirillaceae bacterium]